MRVGRHGAPLVSLHLIGECACILSMDSGAEHRGGHATRVKSDDAMVAFPKGPHACV